MTFTLNSELYAAPSLAEGVDYARRHRRHERFDDTLARTDDGPKTTILAPHGGGIEPGTSELCLAVAGYHPASNIVNRTLLGMGAQLELSKPLRDAMFTEHTRSQRKHTTTQLFWTFVAVCRDALDRLQAEQLVARPDLRCRAELG